LKLAMTGASGLIGRSLCERLTAAGHIVVALVRRPPMSDGEAAWSPDQGIAEPAKLGALDGVIHLAGENIAAGRWTRRRMEAIRRSRVDATRRLVDSFAALSNPPRSLLCASAVGIYGDRGDEQLDESSPAGQGFLAEVCTAWEAAAATAERFGARRLSLRLGVVLTPSGGALARMLPVFRWGLGAVMGDGRQHLAWVSIDDAVGAMLHILDHEELRGPVNLVAPEAVTAAAFAQALAAALGRRVLLRLPGSVLRALLGRMADETLLASTRVSPRKLLDSGYRFRHPCLTGTLSSLLGGVAPA
jgi:uncharacterized protein (TIGR01777 family)